MTLWDKGAETDPAVLRFSAGREFELDARLVPWDVLASIAHARMLGKIGVLTDDEVRDLRRGLDEISALAAKGEFPIQPEQEDCHTAIEEWLVANVGEVGKKIHLGRSRNDQVLAALRRYELEELRGLEKSVRRLGETLRAAAAKHQDVGMVGYTHVRRAMPTTVGTWLGAFCAALDDDATLLRSALLLVDRSPLGTGAGYGIPVFDLDRELTARLAGFDAVIENPIHAQMTRGKTEAAILHGLVQVMLTLNRLATDLILFSSAEFGFVELPPALCTGSSIMPQKQNPDVLELIRAKYHVVRAEEAKVLSLVGNLMTGYQRDLGLTKEPVFTAFDETLGSLAMMTKVVGAIRVDEAACRAAMTDEIHAVEEANRLVAEGMSFRDAYRKVAEKFSG
ncbi:MAG: argininosuccinate lyase [Planctomycetota bacterium]